MIKKIEQIKQLVKKECDDLKNVPDWFYETHLLAVEKCAKFLLKKIQKANKEVVMLGVWLHDLQGIRGIKGDHEKIGATEAEKVMKIFGYDKDIIKKVKKVILSHSCKKRMPKTIEEKILASADAMSQYFNNFYLKIAVIGQRDFKNYKSWVLEKLGRNYNKKIFFDFARNKIKKRQELFKKIFTME